MKWLLPFLLGFTLMLAFQGTVRGHSEHAQYQQWLQGLKNQHNVTCCDGRDNLEVEDWQPLPGGAYKIRVQGDWYDVPAGNVVSGPNRMGAPQAWIGHNNGARFIRCFLPGALM